MTEYEAPAKLNLSLHVMPPGSTGYHPVDSMVQTIDWLDLLKAEEVEDTDSLKVVGADLGTEENLVLKAVAAAREHLDVPPLSLVLDKTLPVAAGLGGGSSDAAAALLAARDAAGSSTDMRPIAADLGADVSLFLDGGGTLRVTGFGEEVGRLRALTDFAAAVVVPDFGLITAEVYHRWDEMEGPLGEPVPDALLPPSLRGAKPMRNDLLPAALDIEPRLGDFMSDVRSTWGTAVCLTGSGSACFGYFASEDEASDAAAAVTHLCSRSQGVALRDHGVSPVAGER